MLPAHLVADNGLRVIEESPNLPTNCRFFVGDLDVSASYPNGEVVFNVSKETTKKELIEIEGVSEFTRRMQGINLSGGATNAIEVCVGLLNLPNIDFVLEQFMLDNNIIIDDIDISKSVSKLVVVDESKMNEDYVYLVNEET